MRTGFVLVEVSDSDVAILSSLAASFWRWMISACQNDELYRNWQGDRYMWSVPRPCLRQLLLIVICRTMRAANDGDIVSSSKSDWLV